MVTAHSRSVTSPASQPREITAFVEKVIHSPEEKNVILSIGIVYGNWAELNLCRCINWLDRQTPRNKII